MLKVRKLKIGIVGCGAIGSNFASFVEKKLSKKVLVWAINDKDPQKAQSLARRLKTKPCILDINRLIKNVDLVVETASQECAKSVIEKSIKFKKDVVILSVGALIRYPSLLGRVKNSRINIYLPSGAICGLDGVSALGLGRIKELLLTTSKPPLSLEGADYLKKRNINLKSLRKEKVVFQGRIQDAVKYFPQNINVAATLFLASGGKKVEVIIKAVPGLKRNIHHINARADKASIKIEVENFPSEDNPKTSHLAILSLEALLKKILSHLKIGS